MPQTGRGFEKFQVVFKDVFVSIKISCSLGRCPTRLIQPTQKIVRLISSVGIYYAEEITIKTQIHKEVLRGRIVKRDEDIRGSFFRDQTAIVHSMPFRRLKHKIQVFFDPDNDHVCTRIEHVMHVATIAATICKGINKNGGKVSEELATVIGLGHDIGHAPFGHAGEKALNELLGNNDGFIHEMNGLRVVDFLANNGKGLNLTYAVRELQEYKLPV